MQPKPDLADGLQISLWTIFETGVPRSAVLGLEQCWSSWSTHDHLEATVTLSDLLDALRAAAAAGDAKAAWMLRVPCEAAH